MEGSGCRAAAVEVVGNSGEVVDGVEQDFGGEASAVRPGEVPGVGEVEIIRGGSELVQARGEDPADQVFSDRIHGRRNRRPGPRGGVRSTVGLETRKSSTGSTKPRPKKLAQTRFTWARAKNGLSGAVSQSASACRGSDSGSKSAGSSGFAGVGPSSTPVTGAFSTAPPGVWKNVSVPRRWVGRDRLPSASAARKRRPIGRVGLTFRSGGGGTWRIPNGCRGRSGRRAWYDPGVPGDRGACTAGPSR